MVDGATVSESDLMLVPIFPSLTKADDRDKMANDEWEISGVFAHRWSKQDRRMLFLTGWVGWPSDTAQWLSEDALGATNECLIEYKSTM